MHIYAKLWPVNVCMCQRLEHVRQGVQGLSSNPCHISCLSFAIASLPHLVRGHEQAAAYLDASNDQIFCRFAAFGGGVWSKVDAERVWCIWRSRKCPACSIRYIGFQMRSHMQPEPQAAWHSDSDWADCLRHVCIDHTSAHK